MAQGEDLGVALIAGREQPSEAADDEVTDGRGEVHRRQNVPTDQAAQELAERSGDGFPAPARGADRLLLGLRVGEPDDEVLGAWLAKESVRGVYLAENLSLIHIS